ncbi:site-specific integrase [Pseudarthrobacter oxydans]|uniref:tyrosine-type recombinase/integrase n=1 Tax=Pseudarthrobacter oxydans TaxID=1671 RepID=UPI0034194E23
MPARWTATDEANLAADRAVIRKMRAKGEEPSAWLLAEYEELTERRKQAKPRRRKGDGGVYQRADGLWCVSLELPEGLDGKRRRKVICRRDKAAVISELRKAKTELEKHGDLATNSITVGKWMAHWMDDIAPQKIRPKTLAGYKTVVNGYIIPALGKKRIDKLTAQDVRTLHAVMQTTPKDPELRGQKELPAGTVMLSSTYTLLAHNALSAALKVALREGKIHTNPCDLVDRPRARVTQQKALTLEQAIRLLQHLATRADGPLWATYLLTGARRGEILGLEAERVTGELDLSWQLQRITDISKAPADWEYRELGGTLYLTRPKSNAGWRIIPLVEPLRSILKLQMGDQTEGLVFTRNNKPWDPDRATKEWNKLLAEAGLPGDIVLHGARHTVVELMFNAGVHETLTQEIVGHSNVAMTRKYKTKGNTPQLEAAMSSLSRLLGQA